MPSGGGRRGTRRVARSTTLSEIDHDKVVVINLGRADVDLTLAEAARCAGCRITGLVAGNPARRALTLRATGGLVMTVATSEGSVLLGEGSFVRLHNVPAGSSFVATSTGLQWRVHATGQRVNERSLAIFTTIGLQAFVFGVAGAIAWPGTRT
ncbi:MAG: hypothetical protein ACO3FX_12145, partial [Gemmobacter sp.]